MTRRPLRFALAALVAAGAVLGGATPASAGLLVASTSDCDSVSSSPVFAPWLDPAQYFRVADGGFESGAAGWQVEDGTIAPENEPYQVAEDDGTQSLALPAGASATSPTVCVGIDRPTVRFFVKRASGDLLSSLRVDVHYVGLLGTEQTLTIGTTGGSASWAPSPVMVVTPSLLTLLPGERTPVRFTFKAQGGSYLVDDVYVDPYGSK